MNRKQVMSMLGVLPQFETDELNEERFVDTVESKMKEMDEWNSLLNTELKYFNYH